MAFLFSPSSSRPIFPREIKLEGKTLLAEISVFFFEVFLALARSDVFLVTVVAVVKKYRVSKGKIKSNTINSLQLSRTSNRETLIDFMIF